MIPKPNESRWTRWLIPLARPLVASLPPQDTEMDAEDAFPVDSNEPPIGKVPSQNYKTTGEDDEASTDTSGTSTSDQVAKPDLKETTTKHNNDNNSMI